MSIEFNENIPIYIQIMNHIKRDIVTGKLKGGDKLSSVREMAEAMKVNPNTIQRAYQELERENVTYTQRGMGTFITEDSSKVMELKREMSKELIFYFIKGMKDLGFNNEEIINVISQYVSKED
ncbi:MAG: GntR family transcriptional regulator [Bacillota bacterium]